jgi:peptide-methionine (S)-S-oxide reductase
MLFTKKKLQMPTREDALPGRSFAIPTAETHFVNGRPLKGPYPEGCNWRSSPWAASGAWSACSGTCPVSG